MLDIRAVVFHYDVGAGRECAKNLRPLGMLEIQDNALLVPLQIRRVEESAVAPRFPGTLDPDDVGAEVSQHLRARGPGAHRREVNDLEAAQW